MKKFLSIILAVTLSSTLFVGCGEKKTVINVYNVGDYIDEEVISLFEKENPDIKVNYETYFTNEEMYFRPIIWLREWRPRVCLTNSIMTISRI